MNKNSNCFSGKVDTQDLPNNDESKKMKKNVSLPTQSKEKKIEYISTKKPVEKSVFYQHSKQGMKYWFEEQKPKSCKCVTFAEVFFISEKTLALLWLLA